MRFTEEEANRIAEGTYKIVHSLDGKTCTLMAASVATIKRVDSSEFQVLARKRSTLVRQHIELLTGE